MTMGILLPVFCMIACTLNYPADTVKSGITIYDPPFITEENVWVDSVMNTLSIDQKIGQLLMYPAYSNKDKEHEDYIKTLIYDYHIGGLIFMQGDPISQVNLLNQYQNISDIPLLIAMDAEWSLSMRLKNTILYPRQMMLGAIQDNELIYEMGAEFARQLKLVGAHVNFAPVADVNNNSKNPVINCRSFGEDIMNVSEKSYYYMKGMQDNGVIATGKHFPGHGDTDVDSHYSLPVINHEYDRLDSLELFPFRYLIKKGMGAIMTAHLFVPAIDDADKMPTSLSAKAINDLLIEEMGFKGLIFTDALNMGGVTNHFKAGESDVMALIAGNDVLLFPNKPEIVVNEIKKALKDGRLSEEDIDNRCRKVLQAKYWAGLTSTPKINSNNLIAELNNQTAAYMKQRLIENAVTLVKNEDNLIPVKGLDSIKIASISFGNSTKNTFHNRLDDYAEIKHYIYSSDVNQLGRNTLINQLKEYDLVIVSVHNTNRSAARKFGIGETSIKFIDDLAGETQIVLNLFANPYSLDYFKNAEKMQAIIVSYNDWRETNDITAQIIFGGIPAKGRLPVSPNQNFPVGSGFDTEKTRLKYSEYPIEAGVDHKMMYKIDSLIEDGLNQKAYPSARVMLARNGIVFYNKTSGRHSNNNSKVLDKSDIYDLASVTKILSTSLAFMKLYEEGKIALDDKISKHLDYLKNSDKRNITFREALIHQSGLRSWIPFFQETTASETLYKQVYSPVKTDIFGIQVADNMYMLNSYVDTIYDRILKSNLNNHKRYVYSDLGFYMLKDAVEHIADEGIDKYNERNFYKPMGLWSMCFNPLQRFDKDNIVPTENDQGFRKQLLHGFVHDQGTAMLGGIGGPAGLFGNAPHVTAMMQMLLDKGSYGGVKYFEPETVELFTSYNNRAKSRRGLGFDKPDPRDREKGVGGELSSESAFGHLGFTGIMTWADPEYDLVYVFLSNRIYPDSNNRRLQTLRVRGNILDVIYEAIIKQKNNTVNEDNT
jgi:beta-N-acetylhexosaminidase